MSERLTSVLIEDPELGAHLSALRLQMATRDCVAQVATVKPGPWPVDHPVPSMRFGIGLLVLDGLLIRRVGLNHRFGAELLGTGDLLRPWESSEEHATLPYTGGWRALRATRVAILDRPFAVRIATYPEVTSALFGRATRRSRSLAVSMSIVHQPRIDTRVHLLLWELADRWGTVGPDGVHLPVRLTHATLGELVAAHRPSVSKALSELAERGAVRWTGEAWLLHGPPPVDAAPLPSSSANGDADVAPRADAERSPARASRAAKR